MDNTQKTVENQSEKPFIHPLIKFHYLPRNIGYILFGIIFVTLFYDNKNQYLWVAIIVQTFIWPQIAYLIGKKSKDPRKTELKNMCFEAFLCGVWMVIISFRLWPCTAFFIGGTVNFLATGGTRLFMKGMASLAAGVFLTGMFIGFKFIPDTSLATAFASIASIMTYSCIVAYMSFIYSKKLSSHKKSLKEANDEVKQKLIITQHEINERKRIEKALQEAIHKAKSANKEKSRFLASMSHEIRTPMNAIIGMTEIALRSENDNDRLDHISIVRNSANHLLTIINDILDFSKTESGNMALEYTDFHLPQLLEDVKKTFDFNAKKNDLYLKINIENDVCHYVKGDSARLKQVLINITGNAFKFTHEGGVTINLKQFAGKPKYKENEEDKQYLNFSIHDTGIGVPKEQIESIFESFTQAERKTTRLYGGTGLGLAISKRIIDLMDGDIWVESEVGKGSTFYFKIPLYPGNKPENQDESENIKKLKKSSRKLRILLAEDNAINIKVASTVLNNRGHDLTVATNGNEALKKLKQGSFDLVLMDIEMPEMNGLEATTLIRSGKAGLENSNIPIIAMTAHVLDEMAVKCKKAGMNHLIPKPINIMTLDETLHSVIDINNYSQ